MPGWEVLIEIDPSGVLIGETLLLNPIVSNGEPTLLKLDAALGNPPALPELALDVGVADLCYRDEFGSISDMSERRRSPKRLEGIAEFLGNGRV